MKRQLILEDGTVLVEQVSEAKSKSQVRLYLQQE